MRNYWLAFIIGMMFISCMQQNREKTVSSEFTGKEGEVKLIVLAPGHFHANLLQKSSIPQVNDSVYVYSISPDDAGLIQYLSTIESFNNRAENSTKWNEIVYTGEDFTEKMLNDKKGNVVVLAGNNKDKTEYIHSAIVGGFNVLSDKPMAINHEDFLLLEKAYENAELKGVQLYDMMTERYDILNIIEKELINDPDFFGELKKGTPEDPAIYMESVHHFYKEVSGAPLIRPAWYYDVEQQGEGIADVTTHLIDLLFWKCFPNQSVDYKQDIRDISSTHWATEISLSQFTQSTGEKVLPEYLQKYLNDSILKVYSNGTINFEVKGLNAGLKVIWNYEASKGSGDTFKSLIKGTKAIIKTVQDKEQSFIKQLYVQKSEGIGEKEFLENLQKAIKVINATYPFVSAAPTSTKGEYIISIPLENREGHEFHFKHVAESFFCFLSNKNMPNWEKTNTLAKYYVTTKAVEVAKERK
ncbi:MAG: putative oxidoreductase C-terminal domain-containing protein [Dysgonamonadaceae bacterium]|nr:putative oxidoreductase C-terminal domain-containing protein [Dysgonamonadaceae bacterium]